MAVIMPFRGIRFNKGKVADLAKVVTPPYDVIDADEQDNYYEQHPNNIIRLEYGKIYPDDNEENNRYTRAAADFQSWLTEGILVREDKPAFYFYEQVYTVNSEKKTRSGLICLLRLEEYENKVVLPHEETIPKHKADRLALMHACHANFSPIFGIYADEKQEVTTLLRTQRTQRDVPFVQSGSAAEGAGVGGGEGAGVSGAEGAGVGGAEGASMGGGAPDVAFVDEQGQEHRLWVVTDSEVLQAVHKAMLDKKIYIADGHHRYETALKFRDELRASAKDVDGAIGTQGDLSIVHFSGQDGGSATPQGTSGNAAHDYVMVTLVNIFDPGLVILPTHRMVKDVPGLDTAKLLQSLGEDFQVTEIPLPNKDDLGNLWVKMKGKRHTFGMYAGDGNLYLISLKDSVDIASVMPEGKSSAWQGLDVSVLHTLVLDKHLGIGAAQRAAGECLSYTREEAGALEAVDRGEYQLVFFLNPTSVKEVTRVASDGEKMPQKSTFFYPKLITGLVLNGL